MTDTRDRILTCACDLYLEDGFEGFSMRKLARSVGVTAPALYRHFEGKEQLLLEIVGEAYRTLSHHLHGALGGPDAMERFRMAGDGYLAFALLHPRYYEILYSYVQLLGLEELPAEIEAQAQGLHQFWIDRVRECMEAGILHREDPEAIARTFWALTHGLLSLYHRRMLPVEEEEFREIFRSAARRLMRGVATEDGVRALSVPEAGGEEVARTPS